MIKRKVPYFLSTILALLAVSAASLSASTSFPFVAYQPKMPKSLIKEN
ncbi:AgrD family cyclic lactone autoinducer peptide [Acetivibrio clariflavus]|uniref:Cyclic lactone autoinducer peptide n=1 Tax=Acetivibrio clariflavus (strain DSM 19732 / NBRC 101661 / EBR45) TaxID=720554 RepID=G8LVB3_ACECE|nr:cyclic lactone autoinducer peptide [Acetivibrio clariflavus]AEV67467.1 hypothetical protein Clocl_0767 [Acetivibrio clariflavus DSM 19732]